MWYNHHKVVIIRFMARRFAAGATAAIMANSTAACFALVVESPHGVCKIKDFDAWANIYQKGPFLRAYASKCWPIP